jgi:hypothetical protein
LRALARFEAFVEHLVERPFARLPGAAVQPVQIAKQVLRDMEANQAIGPGRIYVPNHFAVSLNPDEHSSLEPLAPALCRELAGYVAESAAEHGWSFLGPVTVGLTPDAAVRHGQIRVAAKCLAADGSAKGSVDESQRTMAIHIQPTAPTSEDKLLLVGSEGSGSYPVQADAVTIGRALDNDIVLEHQSVSRHHAEIRRQDGGYVLTDLASTNGTAINGRSVASAKVRHGDQVRFGRVEFTFQMTTVGDAGR